MKPAVLLDIILVVQCCSASIHTKLRYFETLTTADIVSRSKRNAVGRHVVRKEVSFWAFSRRFRLVLFPGSSVLAPDVRAATVDGQGNHSHFIVRHEDFFKGHLAGKSHVPVRAHFEDGLLCASVHFPYDTYTVEPSWRHLPGKPGNAVIIYRSSDILWSRNGAGKLFPATFSIGDIVPGVSRRLTPGSVSPNETDRNPTSSHGQSSEKVGVSTENSKSGRFRRRRSPSNKKICPMLIVADYSFYRDVGRSDERYTTMYITWMLDDINRMYMETNWDDKDMKDYGIQIKEFKIHTEYTDVDGHYNQKRNDSGWGNPLFLNTAFILHAPVPMKNFCLRHLYSNANIGDFEYGFGYIADTDPKEPGGICSPITNDPLPGNGSRRVWYHPNTACVTARHNPQGGIMLKEMIQKTSGHEIGHNWGAWHDDTHNDTQCMPPANNSHNFFIMKEASNPVPMYPNNWKFSPCSKGQIAAVLRAKADNCFIPPNTEPDPWMERRKACLRKIREKLSPLLSSTILRET